MPSICLCQLLNAVNMLEKRIEKSTYRHTYESHQFGILFFHRNLQRNENVDTYRKTRSLFQIYSDYDLEIYVHTVVNDTKSVIFSI